MSDFGNSKWVVGRKVHRCAYCAGLIPKGEKHNYWAGRFDGEFQANRMHKECSEDFDLSGDEEYTFGDAPRPERIVEYEAKLLRERTVVGTEEEAA